MPDPKETSAQPAAPQGEARRWEAAALIALLLLSDEQLRAANALWRRYTIPLFAGLLSGDTFDPTTQRYGTGGNGQATKPASDDAVRNALLLFLAALAMELHRGAERMAAGKVPVAAWRDEAAVLIRSAYVAAFALGVGGINRITSADLSTIRGEPGTEALADSLVRLERFAALVADHDPALDTVAAIEARIALYVGPAYALFEAGRGAGHRRATDASGMPLFTLERSVLEPGAEHCHSTPTSEGCAEAAEAGWVPIGTLPQIGQRSCGPRCRCRMEYGRGQTPVERN
jgi:hypothetical protein